MFNLLISFFSFDSTGVSTVSSAAVLIDTADGGPAPATGTGANIVAAAYANNVNNGGPRAIAVNTVLYTVDATTNGLYIYNLAAGSLTVNQVALVGDTGVDIVAGAGLDIFTDVTRVPSNRLILKNGKSIYELNPANAAIIDRAQVNFIRLYLLLLIITKTNFK